MKGVVEVALSLHAIVALKGKAKKAVNHLAKKAAAAAAATAPEGIADVTTAATSVTADDAKLAVPSNQPHPARRSRRGSFDPAEHSAAVS